MPATGPGDMGFGFPMEALIQTGLELVAEQQAKRM